MKISMDAVKQLTKASRDQISPQELENSTGATVVVYSLDDFTLSFLEGERPKFFGLSFSALAQDFTILSSFELLISLTDETGESTYSIEDESTVKALEGYLVWRAEMLNLTGL